MWWCVIGWVVPSASEAHRAFIFTVKQKPSCTVWPWRWRLYNPPRTHCHTPQHLHHQQHHCDNFQPHYTFHFTHKNIQQCCSEEGNTHLLPEVCHWQTNQHAWLDLQLALSGPQSELSHLQFVIRHAVGQWTVEEGRYVPPLAEVHVAWLAPHDASKLLQAQEPICKTNNLNDSLDLT